MEEDRRAALIAKCEEMLEFLAAQDAHAKLRALANDISALRTRLLAEEPQESPER